VCVWLLRTESELAQNWASNVTTPCPHTRSHYVLFEMFVSLSAWEIAGELCRSSSLALELSGLSLHVCMRFHTSVCSTKESNVDDKMVWGWADFSLFLITYSKEGSIRSSQQVGLLFLFRIFGFLWSVAANKERGRAKVPEDMINNNQKFVISLWSFNIAEKCEERWESADYCIRLLEAADIVWVVRSICSVSLE